MGGENREFMLAIVLCGLVLIFWQIFVGMPTVEQERQQATQQTQTAPDGSTVPQPGVDPALPSLPGAVPPTVENRETVLASSDRVRIETGKLKGSINLTGARIDDLLLTEYRERVEKDSPLITLLSPSGSANAFYAETGWAAAVNANATVPTRTTVWSAPNNAVLTPTTPVHLTWDNGEGLIFKRTISVDEDYLFTIEDAVENATSNKVLLHPFGLISRHGTPNIEGFYILHEGLIGFLGEDGLLEIDYDDLQDDENVLTYQSETGWLGITDKYWAVTLIPNQEMPFTGRFSDNPKAGKDIYQTDYLSRAALEIPPGDTVTNVSRLFAGAKVVSLIDDYQERFGVDNFELLIDWGWFYFITKPLFQVIDFFFKLVGNFGVAILLVTVCIKTIFLPLANKSYASMSKMKKLQPEVTKLRERYGDDKQKMQQEMMAMYKKEKVNPMSGCWPIMIQIPVFFALYKVLFGTIEMRHAPFFGWIQDLSAPDPTSLFNLFGLIPWDPPALMMVGVWPILMGITMFVQMRLNPPPPDPTQAMIFNWMPLFFTFLLASFPAGLIIYWAWNNLLSVIQQYIIMRRHGVKVELWDNLKALAAILKRKPKDSEGAAE